MPEMNLQQLEAIREALKDPARDLKLNLSSVFSSDVLSKEQIWGVALTSAYYIREPRLLQAVLADAQSNGIGEAVIQDAQAAAALMGMNTVYYRFRHMAKNETYKNLPARLRMQWMGKPQTTKADFELFSMAVAALAGCEMCINSHEASILQHGLSENHVHECIRLAAVLNGVAVAMNC
jgi:alkyl hydroperoxide reductase subunit D